jgi:hypothetical protein
MNGKDMGAGFNSITVKLRQVEKYGRMTLKDFQRKDFSCAR